jgi:ribonuclease HI
MNDVTIEIEADAEGYRYRLSCIHAGKNVEKSEHTEDFEHTLNAKYLLALNEALERMVQKSEIKIKIAENGAYVYGAIRNGWPDMWEKNGWKTARGKEVKNKELWQQYRKLAAGHRLQVGIKWRKEQE